VLASHYAEPVDRVISSEAILRAAPVEDSEARMELRPGDSFALLDDSIGWAWGYAGAERRVGYLRSDALSQQTP
jgi:hypothetical protein